MGQTSRVTFSGSHMGRRKLRWVKGRNSLRSQEKKITDKTSPAEERYQVLTTQQQTSHDHSSRPAGVSNLHQMDDETGVFSDRLRGFRLLDHFRSNVPSVWNVPQYEPANNFSPL